MTYVILGIAFVLFNVISFTIPTKKTSAFWIAYAFTILAFALQIIIWSIPFKKGNNSKNTFLNIPFVVIGIKYLVAQNICCLIFMFLPFLANWSAVLICSIILGISAICLIGTQIGKEEIIRVEDKTEKKASYIKELLVNVEILESSEKDADTKASLTRLAEKIRYSDPISSNALADIENKISEKINILKSSSSKSALINELENLLDERNKKAKFFK